VFIAISPRMSPDEYAWARPDYHPRAQPQEDNIVRPWTTAYRAAHDGPQIVEKDAEEPKLRPFNYMFAADGKIYMDGQPIKPAPSTDDEKYPAKDGWQSWIHKKITFYMKKKDEAFAVIPVAQKETKLRITNPDDVTHEFTVHNADGKLYDSSGAEMQLTASNNKDHPAADGWKMFDSEGERFYFNVNDGHGCQAARGG